MGRAIKSRRAWRDKRHHSVGIHSSCGEGGKSWGWSVVCKAEQGMGPCAHAAAADPAGRLHLKPALASSPHTRQLSVETQVEMD